MSKNQITEKLTLDAKQFDSEIQKVIRKVDDFKARSSSTKINFGTKGFDALNGKIGKASSGLQNLIGKTSILKASIAAVAVAFAKFASDAIKEGVEIAMAAEGIRNAFARIGDESTLNQLREQTRGLITDVELMKAAVKFKNFNLQVEQLGTFLAFAQRQAKETGESMDYLVDSIVNGLGRGSVQILDNLGISAKEIKERMKEGGEMTEVVAQIIKERMAEAGEDIETLSEKAARSETDRQNALEQLGQAWAPLTQASDSFWSSLVTWTYKVIARIGDVISRLFDLRTALSDIQGNTNKAANKTAQDIRKLKESGDEKGAKNKRQEYYNQAYKQIKDLQEIYRQRQLKEGDRSAGYAKLLEKYGLKEMTINKKTIDGMIKAIRDSYEIVDKAFNESLTPEIKTDDDKTSTKTNKILKDNEKVYKIQAETIEEIDDNIDILNKKLKKTKPNTKEFKKLNDDLKYWKNKKVEIELSLSDNSRSGISQRLNNLRRELDETEVGSEKYIEIVNKIVAEEEKLRKVDYDMNKTFMVASRENSSKILSNVMGIYEGFINTLSPLGIFNAKLKEAERTFARGGFKSFNDVVLGKFKSEIQQLEEEARTYSNFIESLDFKQTEKGSLSDEELDKYQEAMDKLDELYKKINNLKKASYIYEPEINLGNLLGDYSSTVYANIDFEESDIIKRFQDYRNKLQELVENGFIGEVEANWEVSNMNLNIKDYINELYKNRYIEELKEKGVEVGTDFEVDDEELRKFIKEQEEKGLEINIPLIPEISQLSISSKFVKAIQDEKGNLLDEAERLGQQLEEYLLRGLIDYDTYKREVEKIIEKLNVASLPPIKLKSKLEFDYNKMMQDVEDVADAFYAIDNVVQSFDDLNRKIDEGASAWEIFMSTVQTVVTVLQTVGAVMKAVDTISSVFGNKSEGEDANKVAADSEKKVEAKKGEATANVITEGSKLPFPESLLAIAAGVAAIVAAYKIIGSFANGGVVGGSQYAGDALLAKVNSGEMILNGSQQKKLFDMIDGGKALGTQSGQVQFVIKGKDLVGVSRNYNDKLSKIK